MTETERIHSRRWWTLGVLCLSLLIVTVGNSSLNVAIPTLSRELDATTSQLQWVVAAYSLVFAGLLFTAGSIGDRFGRKGALQLGLAGFLVGVIAASGATEMWQLIAARAFLGGCAAFIMPSTLSILVNVFPAEERAQAIAVWAGVAGGAGALGPVATGWLLSNGYWYGSVFLVNAPIVVTALVAGMFLVPSSRDPEKTPLDLTGAALSTLGISSIVFALIQAPDKGWTSGPTLIAFAAGAATLTAFVAWEQRTPQPMLDISYFSNRTFSTASAGMVLVFLAMYGVMFLVSQFFQLVLGYSPLSAAVRFLPMAPIMMVVSPATPRIVARIGANRTVAIGLTTIAASFAAFATVRLGASYPYVLGCVLLLVTGISLTMSPLTASIMSAIPPSRAGSGSAMNDATRELGAALGVAVLGSIAASRYARGVDSAVHHLSGADQAAVRASLGSALETAAHLPADVGERLVLTAQQAFLNGIHEAALVGSLLALVAAALTYRFLPRTGDEPTTPDLQVEIDGLVADELVEAIG